MGELGSLKPIILNSGVIRQGIFYRVLTIVNDYPFKRRIIISQEAFYSPWEEFSPVERRGNTGNQRVIGQNNPSLTLITKVF
jgi:hypothetical protein